MFLACQSVEHFLDQVVDEKHLQLNRRVVDRNWEVIGDVITESADGAVVVRFYPFAHKVWKPVDQHFSARFLGISEEQVLPSLLDKPYSEVPNLPCSVAWIELESITVALLA
jgi:hypothetical protein